KQLPAHRINNRAPNLATSQENPSPWEECSYPEGERQRGDAGQASSHEVKAVRLGLIPNSHKAQVSSICPP
ncbi:MAG TPA: hypothetical protein VM577_04915, partial [Anaerovoracaceae bacterium]|nr:hypothetical protein [Anaerovoracaceae bacterium]